MYLDHLQRVSSHFVSSEVSYSVDSYPNLDHSYSVCVSLYQFVSGPLVNIPNYPKHPVKIKTQEISPNTS